MSVIRTWNVYSRLKYASFTGCNVDSVIKMVKKDVDETRNNANDVRMLVKRLLREMPDLRDHVIKLASNPEYEPDSGALLLLEVIYEGEYDLN